MSCYAALAFLSSISMRRAVAAEAMSVGEVEAGGMSHCELSVLWKTYLQNLCFTYSTPSD